MICSGRGSIMILSICTPAYNAEKFILETYESIKKSSEGFKDFEWIIVNDGSVDKTKAILDDLKSKEEWIKVITQSNKGLGAARNAAKKAAIGKYIYAFDADDLLKSNFFNVVYKLINSGDYDFIWFNGERSDGKKDWWLRKIKNKKQIYKFGHWGARNIHRKELSDKFLYYPKNGDVALHEVILKLDLSNSLITDENIFIYRVGHQSMSSGLNVEVEKRSVEYSSKLLNISSTKMQKKIWRKYLSDSCAIIALIEKDLSFYRRTRKNLKIHNKIKVWLAYLTPYFKSKKIK